MNHTNQKGTLVSPGPHWFPQAQPLTQYFEVVVMLKRTGTKQRIHDKTRTQAD